MQIKNLFGTVAAVAAVFATTVAAVPVEAETPAAALVGKRDWAPAPEANRSGHHHHHHHHLHDFKPPVIDHGKIVFEIPNHYLNNASQILDIVQSQVVGVGSLINILLGNHKLHKVSPEHAADVVARLEHPLHTLRDVLLTATHVVKTLGLKIKTPDNLKETAADPNCDGVCLLLKANNIVTEITAFSTSLAQKVGLEQVAALVKPVIDAAEGLIIQLDGDLPDAPASADSGHHHHHHGHMHRIHQRIKGHLRSVGYKIAKHLAKKYLRHVARHNEDRYYPTRAGESLAERLEALGLRDVYGGGGPHCGYGSHCGYGWAHDDEAGVDYLVFDDRAVPEAAIQFDPYEAEPFRGSFGIEGGDLSGPEHAQPEHVEPEHVEPEHVEPEHTVPAHAEPEHTVPVHAEPWTAEPYFGAVPYADDEAEADEADEAGSDAPSDE